MADIVLGFAASHGPTMNTAPDKWLELGSKDVNDVRYDYTSLKPKDGIEKEITLDIVDNLLNKGVVLNGDLTLALARVDLVYARLSLLLSAADRVLPGEQGDFIDRHHARRELRKRRRSRA